MQRKEAFECILGALGAMVLFSLLFTSYMMYEAPNAGPIFTITMLVWGYFGYRCTSWAWTSFEDLMRRRFSAGQGGRVMTCLLGALVAPVSVPFAFLVLGIRYMAAGDPPPAPAAAPAKAPGAAGPAKMAAKPSAAAQAAQAEARSRWERRNEAAQGVPDEEPAAADQRSATPA